MPSSGCSVLHGVNPNFFKKSCLEILNKSQQVAINDLISSMEEVEAKVIPHTSLEIKQETKKLLF